MPELHAPCLSAGCPLGAIADELALRERGKVMADCPPTKQQPSEIVNEMRQSVASWRQEVVEPT